MTTEFKEEQKFTQWWLWLILIGVGGLQFYAVYKQLILGEAFGENPMSNLGLILLSILVLGLIIMFRSLCLRTRIDQHEIRMNFFPFASKRIPWKKVRKAEIVNYGFVGGWGMRLWTKYGTVYNIKGNKGLAIELENGNKFLIGTQRVDELNEVLKKKAPKTESS